MEIALSTVIDAARRRLAAVTAEAAGYVVLLVVQQVAKGPCRVRSDGVFLSDAGDVRLQAGTVASAHHVELELRQLLASLVALSQSTPPALKAAAERVAGGDLGGLESELLAALIPINHAAARRALARLYREAQKASISATPVSPVAAAEPLVVAVAAPPAASELPLVAALAVIEPAIGEPSVADLSAQPDEDDDLKIDVDVMDEDVASVSEAWSARPSSLVRSSRPVLLPYEPLELVPVSISDSGAELPERAELKESDIEEYTGHRSDLRELLAGFLSHTRCEERMTEDLRRMIGVEAGPARVSSVPALVKEVSGPASHR